MDGQQTQSTRPYRRGNDRRTVVVFARATPAEREQIRQAAAAAGQTLSDYVRHALDLPTDQ